MFNYYHDGDDWHAPVDETRCRAGIWDNFHNYQCQRKKSVKVDEHWYCKQHAKIAQGLQNIPKLK